MYITVTLQILLQPKIRLGIVWSRSNTKVGTAWRSWYNLPDLVGEKWKPVTEDDHKTLNVPLSDQTEYWVSNMSRFKFVTKSTKNAKITNYQEKVRPRITLMNKHLFFYRIVALVFHPDQLNAKIAELKIAKQKSKTGEDYTFATLLPP